MRFFSLLFTFLIGVNSLTAQQLKEYTKTLLLMGSRFEVTAVAESEAIAWKAIEAGISEITRIEQLISSWDVHSQTSEINRQAGINAVKVDKELFDLIARSKKMSALTQGAFDML